MIQAADKVHTDPDNFFIITESSKYILGANWEHIYLVDKETGDEVSMGELDVVVNIGLIDTNNKWAITGREIFLIWKDGEVFEIDHAGLKCVERLTLAESNEVIIEVDSMNLCGNQSKWMIDMNSLGLIKLSGS